LTLPQAIRFGVDLRQHSATPDLSPIRNRGTDLATQRVIRKMDKQSADASPVPQVADHAHCPAGLFLF